MGTSDNDRRVFVVGGGIIGTSCALRLQRGGYQVTLLEKAGIGEGCSFGNAGCISPASIVPMAMPGMLRSVPKWLMDPQGPLTVKWAYLPKAAPWLLRWIRNGNRATALKSSQALHDLHSDVFDGYRDLLGPEQFDDLIRPVGHLYLWRQEPQGLGDVLGRELRDRQGIRSVMLRGGEIQDAEPQLNSGFAVGMLLPDNGYTVNSERLVKALAANFTAAGGVLGRRNVLGFKDGSLGPEALYTDCGSIAVGGAKLVIAAGAWSVRLADKLFGHSISLETERGYHVMLRSPSIQPRRPIMDCSRKFIATPMEHGLRVAGTVEIGGLDAPPDYRRAEALVSHARALLRNLEFEEKSVWMGFRPSTSDSLPVIDQSKKFPNVYAAFGHGHLGMTGGPGTARLLGEIVAGKPTTIDRSPFRIDRF